MDVTLTQVLAAVANRLAQVPGIASAYYPPPNVLDEADLPAIVVFAGDPNRESVIQPDMDGQMWTPAIMARLYGVRQGDTPEEMGPIDALITPIVDAFPPGPVAANLAGLGGHVDRCHVISYRAALGLKYAGIDHYGAEFSLSVKFHRYQEDLP